jgi:hypothetical protein
MIAHRAGGIYIYDEKTTSSLGQTFSQQWEMRSQFTGYEWALLKQGIKADGSIVRGISILKTKYDTMEVPTYRTQYEIERWYNQTLRDVKAMIQCWEEGYWDYDLDASCNSYGQCSFTKICKSSDPEAWLPTFFEQRVWDPLLRKETTVQEYEASWGHVRAVPLATPSEHQAVVGNSEELDEELAEMMKLQTKGM